MLRRVRLLHESATQLARFMVVLARTHFIVWEVERERVGGMLFFMAHRSPYMCVSCFEASSSFRHDMPIVPLDV